MSEIVVGSAVRFLNMATVKRSIINFESVSGVLATMCRIILKL